MLHIEPLDALIDVPRVLTVDGLRAGEQVRIDTHTVRGGGVNWRSSVVAQADAQGKIDLSQQEPVSGSYAGVDPMGLCWSQVPDQPGARDLFPDDVMTPLDTTVTVRRDDGQQFEQTYRQRLAAPGVQRQEVREQGLVGTVFHPAGPGPHPAIMILNGSGGGINEPRGALWASHGFTAFSLAYFKAPGLSPYISNTPLEYLETGLRWLRQEFNPLGGFVAIAGQSRGGELVMMLGSMFPELVSAVLGYVPSAVVNCAQNACDPELGREGDAWLYQGKAIPNVWTDNQTATWAPWDFGPEPRRHDAAMRTSLDDPQAVARARIPVEKTQGPILLLSGGDDGSWPSSRYCEMMVEALQDHPYPVIHHDYPQAGHSILFPYVPTTQLEYAHPVSKRVSTSGGKPEANAQADEHSWQSALSFTRQALKDTLSRNA